MVEAAESSLWYLLQPNALRELRASAVKDQKEGKDMRRRARRWSTGVLNVT
jgi:hypothetical protein